MKTPPTTDTGVSYDTTDNKPKTITTANGDTYELVPVLTKGSETGQVVQGVTTITYVYKKVVPVKPTVTTFVDEETGQPVSPQEDGSQPKKDISTYVYVRTEVDADGNVKHIYKKVTPPTPPSTEPPVTEPPVTPPASDVPQGTVGTKKVLPQTGQSTSSLALTLIGLFMVGGLAYYRKKYHS